MQISNLAIDELTTYPTFSFRIFDFDDTVACKDVIPSSNNLSAIRTTAKGTPNQTAMTYGDVTITGGESTGCGIAITTRYAAASPVVITLSLSDGRSVSQSSFNIQVKSTNSAPEVVVAGQASISLNEDQSPATAILLPQFQDNTARGSPAQMNFEVLSNPVKGSLGSWPSDPGAGGSSISYTPAPNANGSDSFSYRVCDNDPGVKQCSAVQTVNLSITPVNDPPSISAISNTTVQESSSTSVSFTINDVDNTVACASSVTASSGNTALVLNSGIAFSGTTPNCTASITPTANQSGSANLTFTVSDGVASQSSTFQLTVTPINHAPTISSISSPQSVFEDSTLTINFTAQDQDKTYACSSSYLSVSSTNTALVKSSGVAWGGTWPNCSVSITPEPNQVGSTQLTITVTDDGVPTDNRVLTASTTFTLQVNNTNDTPTGTVSCNSSTTAEIRLSGRSGSSWSISCSGVSDIDAADSLTYSMEYQSDQDLSGFTCQATYTSTNGTLSGSYASSPHSGTCRYKVRVCDSASACTSFSSFSIELNHYQLSISAVSKPTLSATSSTVCTVSSAATFSKSANVNSFQHSSEMRLTGSTAKTGTSSGSPTSFSETFTSSYLIANPPVRDASQTAITALFTASSINFVSGINNNASHTPSPAISGSSAAYAVNRTLESIKIRNIADYLNAITESNVNLDGFQPDYATTAGVCRLCTGNLASLSAASGHSCLIDVSTLKCWGANASSQLGTGNTTAFRFPQSISISSFTPLQVSAGSDFTCTLGNGSSTREIRCAGANNHGQLGRSSGATNTFAAAINFSSRTPVAISSGKFGQYACAILNDSANSTSGHVHCWGLNTSGQLGNGSTTTPSAGSVVAVSSGAFSGGNKNVFALATGQQHACAIQNQGSGANAVYCWGNGSSGKLGHNSTSSSSVPVAVESAQLGTNVLQISAGDSHTCALRSGGDVFCWGDNSVGQLGIGSTTSSTAPVQVSSINANAVQISAGAYHTCALLNDFSVTCWGLGNTGQLGVGSVTTSDASEDDCNSGSGAVNVTFCKKSPAAITFPATATIVSVSAGEAHTCAMSIEGTSYCWGNNANGQLGTSNLQQVSSPAFVCGTGASCSSAPTLTTPRPRMCSRYAIP
jgi:alpha-tubulin suppressor-like RCC1 family protein